MKINLKELREVVKAELLEAKKKKSKDAEVMDPKDSDPSYKGAEALDFSQPLGVDSTIRRQGVANFGPFTEERALRLMLRQLIDEVSGPVVGNQPPLCSHEFKRVPFKGIWETAGLELESRCVKCGERNGL